MTVKAAGDALAVVAVVKPSLAKVNAPSALDGVQRDTSAFTLDAADQPSAAALAPEPANEQRVHHERLRFFMSSPTRAGPVA